MAQQQYGVIQKVDALLGLVEKQLDKLSSRECLDACAKAFEVTDDHARHIRLAFLKEMEVGLAEDDTTPKKDKKSSLKMLHSHVVNIPTGDEKGVYYSLDWGGSNYRVVRFEFRGSGGGPPLSKEMKIKIDDKFMISDSRSELFQLVCSKLLEHMKDNGDNVTDMSDLMSIGFCFSFPMTQSALDHGILMEWTKGFDIAGVVGENVTDIMHETFKQISVPARIDAIVNDTVGTLLAAACDHKRVRIGLILGTGSNAAYIEPTMKGEAVNIEWGNFNKLLPRTDIDEEVDALTPNKGVQFNEKMIAGMYLGEMVRRLALKVFRSKIADLGAKSKLNKFTDDFAAFSSAHVSSVLKCKSAKDVQSFMADPNNGYNVEFSEEDAAVFSDVCTVIANRSADMAAICLTAVLEKTGAISSGPNGDKFTLNAPYADTDVTVGIDGSLYQFTPGYKERMYHTFARVMGKDVAEKVKLVHAEDGSGKGAALAVAVK